MRESASRGFYVVSRAPYGYQRVRVQDGRKERARLEPDPKTASVVRRIFEDFLRAQGMTEVVRALNAEGIAAPKGGRWSKTVLHKLLVSGAYAGPPPLTGLRQGPSTAHCKPIPVERAGEGRCLRQGAYRTRSQVRGIQLLRL
ncbi:MAG: recombinase family protein [Chloroflexi bacterium]|nr:recombinase family protein [Chloroflexota bacterium]